MRGWRAERQRKMYTSEDIWFLVIIFVVFVGSMCAFALALRRRALRHRNESVAADIVVVSMAAPSTASDA